MSRKISRRGLFGFLGGLVAIPFAPFAPREITGMRLATPEEVEALRWKETFEAGMSSLVRYCDPIHTHTFEIGEANTSNWSVGWNKTAPHRWVTVEPSPI